MSHAAAMPETGDRRRKSASLDSLPGRERRPSLDSLDGKKEGSQGRRGSAKGATGGLGDLNDNQAAKLLAAFKSAQLDFGKLATLIMCSSSTDLACVDPETGEGLLHLAAKREDRALCELLVSKGCDVAALDNGGATALHAACGAETDEGALHVITCLLAAGAPRRRPNGTDGSMAVDVAKCRGHIKTCAILKDRAWAVLAATCANDVPELARLLARRSVGGLDAGAANAVAMSLRGSAGAAPLMAAARFGHVDAVGLLLDAGADADKASAAGQLPLDVAHRNGHETVVALLAGRAKPGSKCAERAQALKDGGATIGAAPSGLAALIASASGKPSMLGGLMAKGKAAGDAPAKAAASGLAAKLRAKKEAAALLAAGGGGDGAPATAEVGGKLMLPALGGGDDDEARKFRTRSLGERPEPFKSPAKSEVEASGRRRSFG